MDSSKSVGVRERKILDVLKTVKECNVRTLMELAGINYRELDKGIAKLKDMGLVAEKRKGRHRIIYLATTENHAPQ